MSGGLLLIWPQHNLLTSSEIQGRFMSEEIVEEIKNKLNDILMYLWSEAALDLSTILLNIRSVTWGDL